MTANHELTITGDGSHTLHSKRFDQDYHSSKGAVTESVHVFFEQTGLPEIIKSRDTISILEVGFGTGLNLLLLADLFMHAEAQTTIYYHSIEAYPISGATAKKLNYGRHLDHPELAQKLPDIVDHLDPGFNSFSLIPTINVSLFNGLFDDYKPGNTSFDFIFHDAFSPQANPALWTGDVFKRLLAWSHPGCLLTTYCAASQARGAMAWAGWKVARAPGAPGKREMTVASPSAQPLSHLKRVNEDRLARRYEDGDF